MSRASETARLLWEPCVGDVVRFTAERRHWIRITGPGTLNNLGKVTLRPLTHGEVMCIVHHDVDGVYLGVRWNTGKTWFFRMCDLEPTDDP